MIITKEKLFSEGAEKYDYATGEYQQYMLPEGAVMIAEIGQEIVCADCGEKLLFDDSYSSCRITNHYGIGYLVCEKCMLQEMKDRQEQW